MLGEPNKFIPDWPLDCSISIDEWWADVSYKCYRGDYSTELGYGKVWLWPKTWARFDGKYDHRVERDYYTKRGRRRNRHLQKLTPPQ